MATGRPTARRQSRPLPDCARQGLPRRTFLAGLDAFFPEDPDEDKTEHEGAAGGGRRRRRREEGKKRAPGGRGRPTRAQAQGMQAPLNATYGKPKKQHGGRRFAALGTCCERQGGRDRPHGEEYRVAGPRPGKRSSSTGNCSRPLHTCAEFAKGAQRGAPTTESPSTVHLSQAGACR